MFQSIRPAIAIALGASIGALSRYYLGELVQKNLGEDFGFYGTFIVNIIGCIMIGFFLTLATERIKNFHPEIKLLLTTGFCGAFTTFSSFELETQIFLAGSDLLLAFNYWFSSIVMGIIGIFLGVRLAKLATSN